jgi:N-methylhydantoinase B/oxoprolinase/acetone carboxylase alpha subunit
MTAELKVFREVGMLHLWRFGIGQSETTRPDQTTCGDRDLLCFETWGGGGWGDPLKRDAALVATDVDRGLVTIEGALRYGVVLRDDLSITSSGITGGCLISGVVEKI